MGFAILSFEPIEREHRELAGVELLDIYGACEIIRWVVSMRSLMLIVSEAVFSVAAGFLESPQQPIYKVDLYMRLTEDSAKVYHGRVN